MKIKLPISLRVFLLSLMSRSKRFSHSCAAVTLGVSAFASAEPVEEVPLPDAGLQQQASNKKKSRNKQKLVAVRVTDQKGNDVTEYHYEEEEEEDVTWLVRLNERALFNTRQAITCGAPMLRFRTQDNGFVELPKYTDFPVPLPIVSAQDYHNGRPTASGHAAAGNGADNDQGNAAAAQEQAEPSLSGQASCLSLVVEPSLPEDLREEELAELNDLEDAADEANGEELLEEGEISLTKGSGSVSSSAAGGSASAAWNASDLPAPEITDGGEEHVLLGDFLAEASSSASESALLSSSPNEVRPAVALSASEASALLADEEDEEDNEEDNEEESALQLASAAAPIAGAPSRRSAPALYSPDMSYAASAAFGSPASPAADEGEATANNVLIEAGGSYEAHVDAGQTLTIDCLETAYSLVGATNPQKQYSEGSFLKSGEGSLTLLSIPTDKLIRFEVNGGTAVLGTATTPVDLKVGSLSLLFSGGSMSNAVLTAADNRITAAADSAAAVLQDVSLQASNPVAPASLSQLSFTGNSSMKGYFEAAADAGVSVGSGSLTLENVFYEIGKLDLSAASSLTLIELKDGASLKGWDSVNFLYKGVKVAEGVASSSESGKLSLSLNNAAHLYWTGKNDEILLSDWNTTDAAWSKSGTALELGAFGALANVHFADSVASQNVESRNINLTAAMTVNNMELTGTNYHFSAAALDVLDTLSIRGGAGTVFEPAVALSAKQMNFHSDVTGALRFEGAVKAGSLRIGQGEGTASHASYTFANALTVDGEFRADLYSLQNQAATLGLEVDGALNAQSIYLSGAALKLFKGSVTTGSMTLYGRLNAGADETANEGSLSLFGSAAVRGDLTVDRGAELIVAHSGFGVGGNINLGNAVIDFKSSSLQRYSNSGYSKNFDVKLTHDKARLRADGLAIVDFASIDGNREGGAYTDLSIEGLAKAMNINKLSGIKGFSASGGNIYVSNATDAIHGPLNLLGTSQLVCNSNNVLADGSGALRIESLWNINKSTQTLRAGNNVTMDSGTIYAADQGLLKVSDNLSVSLSDSNIIDARLEIADGKTLTLSGQSKGSGAELALKKQLIGAGNLRIEANAVVSMEQDSTLSGAVSLGGGASLALNSAQALQNASSLSVESASSLHLTGGLQMSGALTLGAGVSLFAESLASAVDSPFILAKSIALGSSLNLQLDQYLRTMTRYALFHAETDFQAAAEALQLQLTHNGSLLNADQYSLVYDADSKTLYLETQFGKIWTAGSASWNTTDANWNSQSFAENDVAIFKDQTDANSATVSLSEDAKASEIYVDNAATAYTLTAQDGKKLTAYSLNKRGSGNLTLSALSASVQDLILSGSGKLNVQDNASLSYSGAVNMEAEAELNVDKGRLQNADGSAAITQGCLQNVSLSQTELKGNADTSVAENLHFSGYALSNIALSGTGSWTGGSVGSDVSLQSGATYTLAGQIDFHDVLQNNGSLSFADGVLLNIVGLQPVSQEGNDSYTLISGSGSYGNWDILTGNNFAINGVKISDFNNDYISLQTSQSGVVSLKLNSVDLTSWDEDWKLTSFPSVGMQYSGNGEETMLDFVSMEQYGGDKLNPTAEAHGSTVLSVQSTSAGSVLAAAVANGSACNQSTWVYDKGSSYSLYVGGMYAATPQDGSSMERDSHLQISGQRDEFAAMIVGGSYQAQQSGNSYLSLTQMTMQTSQTNIFDDDGPVSGATTMVSSSILQGLQATDSWELKLSGDLKSSSLNSGVAILFSTMDLPSSANTNYGYNGFCIFLTADNHFRLVNANNAYYTLNKDNYENHKWTSGSYDLTLNYDGSSVFTIKKDSTYSVKYTEKSEEKEYSFTLANDYTLNKTFTDADLFNEVFFRTGADTKVTISGSQMSHAVVVGGTYNALQTGNSTVCVNSAADVDVLYGGSYGSAGRLTGDAEVILKGGTVQTLYGGNEYGAINNVTLRLESGELNTVYAAGAFGTVEGAVNVFLNSAVSFAENAQLSGENRTGSGSSSSTLHLDGSYDLTAVHINGFDTISFDGSGEDYLKVDTRLFDPQAKQEITVMGNGTIEFIGHESTMRTMRMMSGSCLKLGTSYYNSQYRVDPAKHPKIYIYDGAVFDISGFPRESEDGACIAAHVYLQGDGRDGLGAIYKGIVGGDAGTTSKIQLGYITLMDNASIGGSGSYYMIARETTGFRATLDLDGEDAATDKAYTLTKQGSNTFGIYNCDVQGGTINVTEGSFAASFSSKAQQTDFVLAASANLDVTDNKDSAVDYNSFTLKSLSGEGLVQLNDKSVLSIYSEGDNFAERYLDNTQSFWNSEGYAYSVFSGKVTDKGSGGNGFIDKQGSGVQAFSGSESDYHGGCRISNGRLYLLGSSTATSFEKGSSETEKGVAGSGSLVWRGGELYLGDGVRIYNSGLTDNGAEMRLGVEAAPNDTAVADYVKTGYVKNVNGTDYYLLETLNMRSVSCDGVYGDGTAYKAGSEIDRNKALYVANYSDAKVTGLNSAGFNEATYSGVLTGNGVLTKVGAGTLSIDQTNRHSGGTVTKEGTLKLLGWGALGEKGVQTDSGASLMLAYDGSYTDASGAVNEINSISNNLELQGRGDERWKHEDSTSKYSAALISAVGANVSFSLSGDLSGAGNLLHSGAGTLLLSGNNSYSWGSTQTQGTVQLGSNTAFGSTAEGKDAYVETLAGSCLQILDGVHTVFAADKQGDYVGNSIKGRVEVGQGGQSSSLVMKGNGYWAESTQLAEKAALIFYGEASGNVGAENGGAAQVLSGSGTLALSDAAGQGAIVQFDSLVGFSGNIVLEGDDTHLLLQSGHYAGCSHSKADGNISISGQGTTLSMDKSNVSIVSGSRLSFASTGASGSNSASAAAGIMLTGTGDLEKPAAANVGSAATMHAQSVTVESGAVLAVSRMETDYKYLDLGDLQKKLSTGVNDVLLTSENSYKHSYSTAAAAEEEKYNYHFDADRAINSAQVAVVDADLTLHAGSTYRPSDGNTDMNGKSLTLNTQEGSKINLDAYSSSKVLSYEDGLSSQLLLFSNVGKIHFGTDAIDAALGDKLVGEDAVYVLKAQDYFTGSWYVTSETYLVYDSSSGMLYLDNIVPEPSGSTLALLALSALAARRRRR